MKVLAYGEIMLRLSTADYTRLEDTDNFDACYGGTESNVLVALSHLGDETSYISKVPNNALGEGVIRHLRKHNVGLEHLLVGGSTLGIYFLQPGFGSLPSKVIYHRKGAVVNTILEDDLCYDEIFNGVSWFHVTGISLAISENSKKVSIRLCKEAKKRGVKVSFDFNYRATLWTIDEAKVAFNEIMQYVDVCFGNQYDLKNLGIKGDSYEEMIENFLGKYDVKYLINTTRTIIDANTQSLRGSLYYLNEGKLDYIQTLDEQFEVLDRIGGGDAFVAGIIHILNKEFENKTEALHLGLKCGILKHLVKGDVLSLSETEIKEWINNNKDVIR